MNKDTKVVITGGGVLSGLGAGLEPFWQGLLDNRSAISVKQEWNVPDLHRQERMYFGQCVDFTLGEYFSSLRPPLPLKYSQLAMIGCHLAIQNAGLDLTALTPERIGLILDTSFSATGAAEAFLYKLYQDGPAKVSPFVFTKTTTNCALGDVARAFKIKGPSSILLGENSVCYGYDLIKNGKADVVLCGGFDEIREPTLLAYYRRGYIALLEEGETRTFAEWLKDETGIIIFGEGSAFVVLESAEHAAGRGAAVYAEMVDYHISGDGSYNDFIYERDPDHLTDHLRDFCDRLPALREAVRLVVGGAGLPWHIRDYEAPALKTLWGQDEAPAYTTIKGRTGETFSASPIMSLLAGALCLKNDTVVGTGYDSGQTGLGDQAPTYTRPQTFGPGAYALVNSVHLGGNTVTIAITR